jgi:hypothetical protein
MEVLTFNQFAAKRGFKTDADHGAFRFPHGISKRQRRDNLAASRTQLDESLKALDAYAREQAAGKVRAPTDQETKAGRLLGHLDLESTRAAWRVEIKRQKARQPDLSDAGAVERSLAQHFPGQDEFSGCSRDTFIAQILADIFVQRHHGG